MKKELEEEMSQSKEISNQENTDKVFLWIIAIILLGPYVLGALGVFLKTLFLR